LEDTSNGELKMEKHEPKVTAMTLRGLFTKEGLIRLVFAVGAVLVVLGTMTLAVAFATSSIIAPATNSVIETCAIAGLVTGGGTLVAAGLTSCSPEERDATR
jgi:hypothetical protein